MPSAPSRPHRPRFVALDGPSGAGKTTTAQHLTALLADRGEPVVSTAQPSGSAIGVLARSSTMTLHGPALSCLVAADRYHHTDTVIAPALAAGRTVICDRYLLSAFVLDRLDGTDLDFIEGLYRYARPADLNVVLTAPPSTCVQRVQQRGSASRFHPDDGEDAEREQGLFEEAVQIFRREGRPIVTVANTGTVQRTARRIADSLATLRCEEVTP